MQNIEFPYEYFEFAHFREEMRCHAVGIFLNKMTLDERIAYWKSFVPSVNIVAPYILSGHSADDALAVFAGTKPAAIVPLITQDQTDELYSLAQHLGFSVALYRNSELIVASSKELLDMILLLDENLKAGTIRPEQYWQHIGTYLGYPVQAIEDFVNRDLPCYGYALSVEREWQHFMKEQGIEEEKRKTLRQVLINIDLGLTENPSLIHLLQIWPTKEIYNRNKTHPALLVVTEEKISVAEELLDWLRSGRDYKIAQANLNIAVNHKDRQH